MNNEFKKILLNLAQLPPADQKWVLKNLSPKHQEQFKTLQGHTLLRDANKFRKLPCPALPQIQLQVPLPETCHKLRQEDPLYIAIILEQGQFIWESQFLKTCAHRHKIKEQINSSIKPLKSATKLHLFQQWQKQLSFEDQLETAHG